MLALYFVALAREFRWTLFTLLAAVAFGAVVFALTRVESGRPSVALSVYAAWMALLAQPIYNPPPSAATAIVCAVYPLIGAVVIGEGVVRLAMLMMSSDRSVRNRPTFQSLRPSSPSPAKPPRNPAS